MSVRPAMIGTYPGMRVHELGAAAVHPEPRSLRITARSRRSETAKAVVESLIRCTPSRGVAQPG